MRATEHLPTTGTLLGIDPGGTGKGHTGVVLIGYSDTEPAHLVESWAVGGGLEGFLHWAREMALLQRQPRVICETFVNRNIPGVDLTPVLVEGAVRTLYNDVTLQPASGKNTAVPDKVLKRLGLYDIGKKDHHADRREAARHVVRYLKNVQHMPTLLKGWPRS